MGSNKKRNRQRRRNSETQPTSHQAQTTSDQIQQTSGQELRIRRPAKLLPRRIIDIISFAIMVISLPTICIWDVTVILPKVHEPYSFSYILTFFAAIFLIFNIKGNFLACLIVDTSVDFKSLETPWDALEYNWRWCERCKMKAPPRSWHCKVCKTCILNRDHHCLFVGSCIGHNNYRYFFFFLLYLFIGSALSFVYTSHYLFDLKREEFLNKETLLCMACPLVMLVYRPFSWHNMHILCYILSIVSMVISGVISLSHFFKLRENGACYQCGWPHYNLGLRKNCECAFGKRMNLAWLSPFIKSELPYDGAFWEPSTLLHVWQ